MPEPIEGSREAWRARREARRAKQRADNVVRAKAMNLHRTSPTYKPDTIRKSRSTTLKTKLHIGCSGWYYRHWKGLFYPDHIAGSKWFDYYASHFDTVELNAPFYSWPTINTVKSWIRQAGRRRLVYTVKVSELITHTKRLTRTGSLINDFGVIADLLGPRMGCFLYQLPPSFHYSARALSRIVRQLEPGRKNVVEFRHRSWWNEKVFKSLEEAGIIFCSCSGPRLPDQLVKTADDVYLRFHGTKQWYRHDYTKEELSVWVDRVRDSGAKTIWAYFNNDREGHAIHNAQLFKKLLKRAC